ncbi:MAG: hypothetical protein AAFR35_02720 [Pseudomonadota bacterium]
MNKEKNEFRENIEVALSMMAGLLLFFLAVIDLSGMPAKPVESLTILLEPTGLGNTWDTAFFIGLGFLGVWLTLGFFIRTAASLALGLILTKILLVKGLLAFGLTVGICVMISVLLCLRRSSA